VSDQRRSDVDPARLRPGGEADLISAGLDAQQRLVAEAILLVSRGGSPRVTITGLRDGEGIVIASRALAAASGVRLIAVPAAENGGADVRVIPLDLCVEGADRLQSTMVWLCSRRNWAT
jgi:hypothetical protein